MKALATLAILLVAGAAAAAAPGGAAGLQQQIDAAPAGATLVIAGRHGGGITIRRPLQLVGERGAVIDGQGRGTVIRIEAPGVTLRGLTIVRSGRDLNTEDAGIYVGAPGAVLDDLILDDVLFGLNLKRAHGALIRRVAVRGMDLPLSRRGDGLRLWYSDGVTLTAVRFERVRDILLWFARGTTLHDLRVARSRYGVHMMYADHTRLLDSRFEDNAVGAYVMYSSGVRIEDSIFLRHRGSTGVALALKESDAVTVRGNLLAANHVGIYLDGTPRTPESGGQILDNVVAGNGTGLHVLSSAAGNVIAGNVFEGNALPVRLDGGARSDTVWQRGGRGNYWSDYAGFDLGGDGVGDQPYRARQWFEALGDRVPELGFFWGSPAVAAADFAARALPLFPPQVLLEDPRPLTRAAVPEAFRGGGGRWAVAVAALLVAAAGGGALWAARPRLRRIPA
ncbi:MAG TPA: nitrous oxide reductase family maturation protein NosD [bacterium]|nr:nitrous oxide reductase family maturation protein NosD [bacterium]